jgi:kinetochore protein Nuf2
MSSWTRSTGRTPHSVKKKKRPQKKKAYKFPILSESEINDTMHDLEMDSCTVEKLMKPKPQFVKAVYEILTAYCMNVTREQLNQADFTSLEAMELLRYPEHHEESIPRVTYFRHVTKLMQASLVNDFSMLEDVIRPNQERFIRNVSAAINFAKFREERLEAHNAMTARTFELEEERNRQLDEQSLLKAQIEEARKLFSKEQQAISKQKEANLDAKNKIDAKKALYEQHKADLRDMKESLSKLKNEEQAIQFNILNAQEEVDQLNLQVVNSPERIRDELRQMEEDLRRLRSSNVSDESTKNAKEHRLAEIEKSMKSMNKIIKLMNMAKDDMSSYKEKKNRMKNIEKSIHDINKEVTELESMRSIKEREQAQMKEKLSKTQRIGAAKEQAAKQLLDQAQKDYDCMLKSKNDVTEEEQQIHAEINKIKKETDTVASNYIAERDHAIQTYNDLQKSVNQYHDRLFGVALTNSSTTPHNKKRQSLSEKVYSSAARGENTPGLPYRRSIGMPVPEDE